MKTCKFQHQDRATKKALDSHYRYTVTVTDMWLDRHYWTHDKYDALTVALEVQMPQVIDNVAGQTVKVKRPPETWAQHQADAMRNVAQNHDRSRTWPEGEALIARLNEGRIQRGAQPIPTHQRDDKLLAECYGEGHPTLAYPDGWPPASAMFVPKGVGKTPKALVGSPCFVECLLRCYWSPLAHPKLEAPATQDAIAYFLKMGAIKPDGRKEDVWRTTPLGKAWVDAICNTEIPSPAFCDAQGDAIKR
jgi:hypothetical protein